MALPPHSTSSPRPTLVWFRTDLRLGDNPALGAAAEAGAVLPVYVYETGPKDMRPMGGAARWWLHHALAALDAELVAKGSRLIVLSGDAETLIPTLVDATGARGVFWNRRYGHAERQIDQRLKEVLKAKGTDAKSFNAHLLNEPWEVTSKAGTAMKVFTPYWRAARSQGEPPAPMPAPASLPLPSAATAPLPGECTIGSLALLPTRPNWAGEIATLWQPGERGAARALDQFLEKGLKGYADNRNRPDLKSTSRLSPHLRFGEISPRQIWHTTRSALAAGTSRASDYDAEKFLTEIGWREFSYHLLYQFPKLAAANFQPKFDAFPWRTDEKQLKAWQQGKTGYPIVDAGMRELWRTGWMHNRVRMIVGSFLVKHLLLDWRQGEDWFWDTLLDADPASNAASWQWVAGSGADAAPYFRIFAPVLQGEKFDPTGDYVRHFVPELARLPAKFIHKPWLAPPSELSRAGVTLGLSYPHPVVVHEDARKRALDAFRTLSGDDAA